MGRPGAWLPIVFLWAGWPFLQGGVREIATVSPG